MKYPVFPKVFSDTLLKGFNNLKNLRYYFSNKILYSLAKPTYVTVFIFFLFFIIFLG